MGRAPVVFLFPLPASLTLPKVALPFHIFEPRYQQMVNDALKHETPIAVLPLINGELASRICYAGVPQLLNRHEDGRMEIALTGETRCRLGELVKEQPYLVYEFRVEDENEAFSERTKFARECIYDGLISWGEEKVPSEGQLETFKEVLTDPQSLLSYATMFLVEDINERLKIMEARSWETKAAMIFKTLGPKEMSLGPFLPPMKWK